MNSNSYEVNNIRHLETNCECKFTKSSGHTPINVMVHSTMLRSTNPSTQLPAEPFTRNKKLNIVPHGCVSWYSTNGTYIMLCGVNFASLWEVCEDCYDNNMNKAKAVKKSTAAIYFLSTPISSDPQQDEWWRQMDGCFLEQNNDWCYLINTFSQFWHIGLIFSTSHHIYWLTTLLPTYFTDWMLDYLKADPLCMDWWGRVPSLVLQFAAWHDPRVQSVLGLMKWIKQNWQLFLLFFVIKLQS